MARAKASSKSMASQEKARRQLQQLQEQCVQEFKNGNNQPSAIAMVKASAKANHGIARDGYNHSIARDGYNHRIE